MVPEAVSARACLDAARAAAAIDPFAEIEVLHAKVDPAILSGDEVIRHRLRERTEGASTERAAAVRAQFQSWRRRLGAEASARVSWKEAFVAQRDLVVREAEESDLLVVGRPHNIDGADALNAAIFESHRPVLVAPERRPVRVGRFARHIAIAWKPGSRARQAVREAGPWLQNARRVSLLMVARNSRAGGEGEAEDLAEAMGFEFEPSLIGPTRDPLGATLLTAARALGADTMVLGASRRNWLIGWARPSITSYVLKHADLPLLLAR